MSVSAFTCDVGGGRRVPLDSLGHVTGLTFDNNWPGGDGSASLGVDMPVTANPWPVAFGRQLVIADGLRRVWSGVLAEPQRGTPWQITGQGLYSVAPYFQAVDSTGALTTNANTALTQAAARGLPYTVPTPLPTPTVSPASTDVAALLDAVATASGKRWALDPNGSVTMTADPTNPTYRLIMSNTPGSRTLDGFFTDMYAKYQPPVAVSGQVVAGPISVVAASTNPPATAPRPFGRREGVYDTTPGGPITSSAAQIAAKGALKLVGPNPSFTGNITVLPGDLTTTGGQPVRLSGVRAGQMIQAVGVQPDPALGELNFTTSVNIVIGQWEYDAVADTATLTPLGAVERDLTALLTAAAASG